MSSTAEFSIDGDPYSNRGYDATNSEVLTLQIESSPGLDIRSCVYEVVQRSKLAPDIAELGAFGGGGASPTTPTSGLDITMPASGFHTYVIRCTINGGKNTLGKTEASFVCERAICIRSSLNSLRKIVPAETTQYDEEYGWADAFSEGLEYMNQGIFGGSAGSTDNALIRADGTGGTTLQGSTATLLDDGTLSVTYFICQESVSITYGGEPVSSDGTAQIRIPNSTTILSKRNQPNDGNIALLASDNSESFYIGSSGVNILWLKGTTISLNTNNEKIEIDSSTIGCKQPVEIGYTVSGSGSLRGDDTFSITAWGPSGDVELLKKDGSENITVGGTNAVSVALKIGASTLVEINGTGLGLWGAAPVAQHSSTGETVGFTAGSGTSVNDDSTFTGNVGSTAYRISDIVKALKNGGIMAG